VRLTLLLAAGVTLAAAAGPGYLSEIESWRAAYEDNLKAPGGWLSVSGLFWLHEGENVVGSDARADVLLREGAPKRAGVLRMKAGVVSFEGDGGPVRVLKPDVPGPPDVVTIAGISMNVIQRGARTGVRLKDPQAVTRREFTGCKWFPAAETWHVKARWVAYKEPHTVPILNILGMTSQEPAPGYAEFTIAGKALRLEPITEDDHLFFLFKDQTSGKTTYGAGRFLYAALPKDGTVELDFNKSENPPCAFTAFATCPLPPRQNILPVSLTAGEMKYGKH
jgi:uncharacterized protein (DUF1684 family)